MKAPSSVVRHARKKGIKEQTIGFRNSRKKCIRSALPALQKALVYSYNDRKARARDFKTLWIQRINAQLREMGLTYSQFFGIMNKLSLSNQNPNLKIERKALANMAYYDPKSFCSLVNQIMASA